MTNKRETLKMLYLSFKVRINSQSKMTSILTIRICLSGGVNYGNIESLNTKLTGRSPYWRIGAPSGESSARSLTVTIMTIVT